MEFRRNAPSYREAVGWVKLCMLNREPALILIKETRGKRPISNCPLSVRELEVLMCASNGMNRYEIGEKLDLSPLTIKSHFARIGRRLGTGDKARMVLIAMRRGWID